MKNDNRFRNIITIFFLSLILSVGMTVLVMADDDVSVNDTVSADASVDDEQSLVFDVTEDPAATYDINDAEESNIADDADASENIDIIDDTESTEDVDIADDANDAEDIVVNDGLDDTEDVDAGDSNNEVGVDTSDNSDVSDDAGIADITGDDNGSDLIDVSDETDILDGANEEIAEIDNGFVGSEEEVTVYPDDEIYETFFNVPSVIVYSIDGEAIYYTDENGVAKITDLFHTFDEGADASETIEMIVNGKLYSFTLYADGSYSGDLPDNFMIDSGVLTVSDIYDVFEISIVDHTAISAISIEPVLVEPALEEVDIVKDNNDIELIVSEQIEGVFEYIVDQNYQEKFAEEYSKKEAATAGVEFEDISVPKVTAVKNNKAIKSNVIKNSQNPDVGVILPIDEDIVEAKVLGASSAPLNPAYPIATGILIVGAGIFFFARKFKKIN